jgi:uncharacterized protein YndB with AHSA1/START domain
VTWPGPAAAIVRQWLPAPPEAVYEQWTDPGNLAEWMCPRPARCLKVEADPRIGGRVTFDIEDAGQVFRVSGNYLTLDRPHRIAFTWSCSTWPDPTTQTIVTVTIDPDGAEASIMTIEHTLLPPALIQQHAHGWATIALQLEATLAQTRAGKPQHSPQEPTHPASASTAHPQNGG